MQVCVCVCVSHTLVIERNDTVIAVFSPPPPFLSRARLKVCVGKKNMCVFVCVRMYVCVQVRYVCLSLPRHHSLQRPTERTETAQSTRVTHTLTHTYIQYTNSRAHIHNLIPLLFSDYSFSCISARIHTKTSYCHTTQGAGPHKSL